jgi:hypothetical protein
MTIIRTKCPTCGDVDMGAGAISLVLESGTEQGAFAFTCPECFAEVSKPASRKTVALLMAAGVEPADTIDPVERADEGHPEVPVEWILSSEDRSPDPEAAPLTLDDLIGFHFLLEDDVAVAEMLRARAER